MYCSKLTPNSLHSISPTNIIVLLLLDGTDYTRCTNSMCVLLSNSNTRVYCNVAKCNYLLLLL